MRKGIVGFIAISMIALVAIASVYMLVKVREVETYQRTIKETTLIEAVNKMEFAKRSLQQALLYSFYQSSYDIGKVGGTEKKYSGNEISYWRVYGDTHYSREKFIKDLQISTNKIFNEYTSALNDPVTVPSYDKVEINDNDVQKSGNELVVISANSTPKTNLQLKGKFYDIQDNPTVTERFNIKTFKMFEIANDNFLKKDSVKTAVENGITNANPPTSASASCAGCVSCESLIDYDGIKSSIRTEIRKEMNKIENSLNENNVEVKLEDKEIVVYIESYQSCPEDCCVSCCGSSLSRGSSYYEIPIGKRIKFQSTSNGDVFPGDPAYSEPCTPSYVASTYCTYSYYATAKVLVKITDKEREYPVYDNKEKTNDMRNIQLQFYDISGTKRLIEPS